MTRVLRLQFFLTIQPFLPKSISTFFVLIGEKNIFRRIPVLSNFIDKQMTTVDFFLNVF